MRLLVVEDSIELLRPLVDGLRRSGYDVDQAMDGKMALWQAGSLRYDLIVLDIMLPLIDGLSVLRSLRSRGNDTRVLLLTARDSVKDRVEGLRAGADDYLVKPFAFDELLARVETLLRRDVKLKSDKLRLGNVVVDLAAKAATRDGQAIPLTPRELAILELLIRRRGRVVSRMEIEEHVYGGESEPASNVIDAAVYALRRKLDGEQATSSVIQTRRGHGYILAPEES